MAKAIALADSVKKIERNTPVIGVFCGGRPEDRCAEPDHGARTSSRWRRRSSPSG